MGLYWRTNLGNGLGLSIGGRPLPRRRPRRPRTTLAQRTAARSQRNDAHQAELVARLGLAGYRRRRRWLWIGLGVLVLIVILL